MNQNAIFSALTGVPLDEELIKQAWDHQRETPGFVDSRDCGLVDAVKSGWYRTDTGELFKGFQVSRENVVLDVGCGAGGASVFAGNQGAHVIFTDIDRNKVDNLRKALSGTQARVIEGHYQIDHAIPLPGDTADRVVCMEVLEHVESPPQLLSELFRVGKPGALYLLTVPDARAENLQKGLAPGHYFQEPNHIQVFDDAQFAQLVKDSGLEIVDQHFYGFFWVVWMMMYWTLVKHTGKDANEVAYDIVQPPYPPVLSAWAKVWHDMIKLPESGQMVEALNNVLPKSQIVIAKKPE